MNIFYIMINIFIHGKYILIHDDYFYYNLNIFKTRWSFLINNKKLIHGKQILIQE